MLKTNIYYIKMYKFRNSSHLISSRVSCVVQYSYLLLCGIKIKIFLIKSLQPLYDTIGLSPRISDEQRSGITSPAFKSRINI